MRYHDLSCLPSQTQIWINTLLPFGFAGCCCWLKGFADGQCHQRDCSLRSCGSTTPCLLGCLAALACERELHPQQKAVDINEPNWSMAGYQLTMSSCPNVVADVRMLQHAEIRYKSLVQNFGLKAHLPGSSSPLARLGCISLHMTNGPSLPCLPTAA